MGTGAGYVLLVKAACLAALLFAMSCSPCGDDTPWLSVELAASDPAAAGPSTSIRVAASQHTGERSSGEHESYECRVRDLRGGAVVKLESESGVSSLAYREVPCPAGGVCAAFYEATLDGYGVSYGIELEWGGETYRNNFDTPALHQIDISKVSDGVLVRWSPVSPGDGQVNLWYAGYSYSSWGVMDAMADGVEIIPSSAFAGHSGPFRVEVIRSGLSGYFGGFADPSVPPGKISVRWSLSVDSELAFP